VEWVKVEAIVSHELNLEEERRVLPKVLLPILERVDFIFGHPGKLEEVK